MKRLRILLGLCALVAFAFAAEATPAHAIAPVPVCSSPGTALSGTHRNLTITGNTFVDNGATLTVNGNLVLSPGSCLDAFSLGTVNVTGNVLVQKGAILGLGCTPGSTGPGPPCNGQTTHDTVGGNIIATQAMTMYLDGDTVHGNIISIGGGPGPTFNPFFNFPIKDNVVDGNIIVNGWQGGWFGIIRNTVKGNVIAMNTAGVQIGDGGRLDSTEIVTNTIGGNLICRGNSPAAQIGDSGGSPNTVTGNKIGECALL